MRKKIWLFLFIALMFPAFANANQVTVERIAGKDRYQTSLRVNHAFQASGIAVIVGGSNYPDALSAGQLAGVLNAPLYIQPKDKISDGLIEELKRIGVTQVYLIGGEAALSKAMEKQLQSAAVGLYVERLSGADRYETSALVAERMRLMRGIQAPLYFVSGEKFPDALSASPFVHQMRGILQLVPHNFLSTFEKATIIGGENSVAASALPRIAGSNRYDTSYLLAKEFTKGDTIILTDGESYPDALSSSGYAAMVDAPVLLVPKSGLTENQLNLIENQFNHVIIIGGENALPYTIENQIIEDSFKDTETPTTEPVIP